MDNPMADQKEYRPPTQSQNLNMLAESIPNSTTAFVLVDKATKCFAICAFCKSATLRVVSTEMLGA